MLARGDEEFVGHCVQAWDPEAGLNVPIAHALHVAPSGPVWPGSHLQLTSWVLPSGDKEFVGHCVQAWGPEAGLNVPIAHGLHSPPSGPVWPGSHLQSAICELLAFELELPGQGEITVPPGQ